MGHRNVQAAYRDGRVVEHGARHVLVRMANESHDDHHPPVYWGGWEPLAEAIALEVPAKDDESEDADKRRKKVRRVVNGHVNKLVEAGLISREGPPAKPGRTQRYALHLTEVPHDGESSGTPPRGTTQESDTPSRGTSGTPPRVTEVPHDGVPNSNDRKRTAAAGGTAALLAEAGLPDGQEFDLMTWLKTTGKAKKSAPGLIAHASREGYLTDLVQEYLATQAAKKSTGSGWGRGVPADPYGLNTCTDHPEQNLVNNACSECSNEHAGPERVHDNKVVPNCRHCRADANTRRLQAAQLG